MDFDFDEYSDTWTCGCGAVNTGDVFFGTCWKCQTSWEKDPVKVETAAEVEICPDCRAYDGFHKINCPTNPLPEEWKMKDG